MSLNESVAWVQFKVVVFFLQCVHDVCVVYNVVYKDEVNISGIDVCKITTGYKVFKIPGVTLLLINNKNTKQKQNKKITT